MHHDRVSDWLTTMPTYTQSVGRLVANHPTRGLAYCSIGTACARAALDPDGGITLGSAPTHWGTRQPAFRPAGAEQHPDTYEGVADVYDALEAWLGIDLLEVRVRLDELPPFLASAISFYLPLARHGAEWILWELNDNLVPLALQRDALRVTLDVDAELVTETRVDA